MQEFDDFHKVYQNVRWKATKKKKTVRGCSLYPSALCCSLVFIHFKKIIRKNKKNVCFLRALSTSPIVVVNSQYERAKLGQYPAELNGMIYLL